VLVSEGGTVIPVGEALTSEGVRPYFGWGTPEPQGTPTLREHVRPDLEHWWEEHEEVLKGDWALENKTVAQVVARLPLVRCILCCDAWSQSSSQRGFAVGIFIHIDAVPALCDAWVSDFRLEQVVVN
jgi:hypothetical protein